MFTTATALSSPLHHKMLWWLHTTYSMLGRNDRTPLAAPQPPPQPP
jgi:hypothetical protein